MPYSVYLSDKARESLLSLDKSIRERIGKKLIELKRDDLTARHFKRGAPVFVKEVNQYRIVFEVKEEAKTKKVWFIDGPQRIRKMV